MMPDWTAVYGQLIIRLMSSDDNLPVKKLLTSLRQGSLMLKVIVSCYPAKTSLHSRRRIDRDLPRLEFLDANRRAERRND